MTRPSLRRTLPPGSRRESLPSSSKRPAVGHAMIAATKWRHYRRIPSLQTYVLVSQAEPQVEVFRRVGDVWQYQAAGPGEQLQLDDQGLCIDVDALYRSGLPG